MPRDAALSCPMSRPLPARRRGVIAALLRLSALHRQRRQLARLDAAALHDLGLSPGDVARELSRSPWDAPSHWVA